MVRKQKLSLREKMYSYYSNKVSLSFYTHKAFILLEMQLGTLLQRTRLIPFFFIARDLCFYRIVKVDNKITNSPYTIIILYNIVAIPVSLYTKLYYRYSRMQYYPLKLAFFFKNYWNTLANYRYNKIWILTNFINSAITAETIMFEYPNLMLYTVPFNRFTRLYQKTQPLIPGLKRWKFLLYSQIILKMRLFDYAAFYRTA